jgi:hypothetical protein
VEGEIEDPKLVTIEEYQALVIEIRNRMRSIYEIISSIETVPLVQADAGADDADKPVQGRREDLALDDKVHK